MSSDMVHLFGMLFGMVVGISGMVGIVLMR